MVIRRRDFLKMLALGAVAAAVCGVRMDAGRAARAARPMSWPGKIRTLSRREIEKPGPWAG